MISNGRCRFRVRSSVAYRTRCQRYLACPLPCQHPNVYHKPPCRFQDIIVANWLNVNFLNLTENEAIRKCALQLIVRAKQTQVATLSVSFLITSTHLCTRTLLRPRPANECARRKNQTKTCEGGETQHTQTESRNISYRQRQVWTGFFTIQSRLRQIFRQSSSPFVFFSFSFFRLFL